MVRAFSRFALALFLWLQARLISSCPRHLAIMPPYIPLPAAMIAISGVAEIVGGLGVCFRATQVAVDWCLIALLFAVFPANIHAISTGMVIGQYSIPDWMLWVRLPFQLLFIACVYSVCLSARPKEGKNPRY